MTKISARACRLAGAAAMAALIGLISAPVRAETTGTESATTSTALADYPTTACIVSGEPLGSMGEPYTIQHEGRTVRFCCKACVEEFKKDPDKYLKKLDEMKTETQKPLSMGEKAQPSGVCIVSGKELPAGGGKEVVINNRTVRLCCGGCEATLRADPEKYLDKLSPEAGAGAAATR